MHFFVSYMDQLVENFSEDYFFSYNKNINFNRGIMLQYNAEILIEEVEVNPAHYNIRFNKESLVIQQVFF